MIVTSGKYKGRKIIAPDEKITRPTLSKLRESIFSSLFSIMDFEGKSFLDVFAGSGIMGIEALSRGFDSLFAMEKNPKVLKVLKENYRNVGVCPKVILGDSIKKIPVLNEKFDVIYIDPPYLSGIYESVLGAVKDSLILKGDGIVILEHTEKVDYESFGYKLIKQKKFSNKFITFLSID